MIVRQARQADLPAVANVHVLSWQACYRGIIPDEFLDRLSGPESEAAWQKFLETPQRTLLVCRAERQTIGFASYGPSRDGDKDHVTVGELYAIYILPEFWRKGCGRALWRRARKELRRAGFKEATVWVLEANARGRHFYHSEHFELDPSVSKDARFSGITLPEIRYWMRLWR